MNEGHGACALALAILCGACVGKIGDGANVGDADLDPDEPPAKASWPVQYNGTPSGMRRLTRDELIVTMEALTGAAPSRGDLPAEPRNGTGPLLAGGLPYIGNELPKLEVVVSEFSLQAAPSVVEQSGCSLADQAQRDCLLAWSLAFAERALRRPARTPESDLYQQLLATADGTSEADADAVGAILHALFISPSFLYRTEIGAEVEDKAAVRALTGNEIAVRLSYLATLAPPDAELLDVAASGKLNDGQVRVEQLTRLLQSDRGKHALAVFVLEWLGSNEPTIDTKSAKYLEGLGADFQSSIRASAEATIADALYGAEMPTVATLFATRSYLDDPAIVLLSQTKGTGVSATGDTSETGREGILMHPQVLAAHTKEDGVSPFQLGKFLRESLLCEPVSPPPPDATQMALPDLPAGASLRENFENKVSANSTCLACHAQFSPLGYAFLPFDPVGRWFQQDPSGQAWDLAGTIATYSGELSFQSPRALVNALGSRTQVQGCFAQGALQWALGRKLVDEDEPFVIALDDVIQSTDGDITAIFETIVAAPEFATAVAAR